MLEHFSDDEIDRIAEFCEMPTYKRDPTQLLPDDAEDDEPGGSDEQPDG
jgi:hypothetical protein